MRSFLQKKGLSQTAVPFAVAEEATRNSTPPKRLEVNTFGAVSRKVNNELNTRFMRNMGLQTVLTPDQHIEFSFSRHLISYYDETGERAAVRKSISSDEPNTASLFHSRSLPCSSTQLYRYASRFDEAGYGYKEELKKHLRACIVPKPKAKDLQRQDSLSSSSAHSGSDGQVKQISFEDIAGNDFAKSVIEESFVLPSKFPSLYKGPVKPWQAILLYGPPGVGKTMLARSVSTHSSATCFWVSLADITSKFIGESEKLLRMLFELAREHSPSIIIIDEMDSLGRKRNGNESETERRIKTEFLKQMDSLRNIEESVSVLATTNMPWELDIAALRRFQRKVLVPMPQKGARKELFRMHMGSRDSLKEEELERLSVLTEGYSGSDISNVVNDALMRPIKEVQHSKFFKKRPQMEVLEEEEEKDEREDPEEEAASADEGTLEPRGREYYLVPCDGSEEGAERLELRNADAVYVRKTRMTDFRRSIDNCKPTVHESFVELYHKFMKKYGHSEQEKLEHLASSNRSSYLLFV